MMQSVECEIVTTSVPEMRTTMIKMPVLELIAILNLYFLILAQIEIASTVCTTLWIHI